MNELSSLSTAFPGAAAHATSLHYQPCDLIQLDGLADRLREERLRLRIHQAVIAQESHNVRMTVYRYERGEQLPSLRYLGAAQRLGMNVFRILAGEDAHGVGAREFRLDVDGLAGRLRIERDRIGWDQGELAAAMNIMRSTQSGYENGYALPPLEYIHQIQRFGIDARFLLGAQRSALLLGWSDSKRLAAALARAVSLLPDEQWRSPTALAEKVLQILMPSLPATELSS